jgi:hypothetical protein
VKPATERRAGVRRGIAGQREVNMSIDQSGQDGPATELDDLRARRRLPPRRRTMDADDLPGANLDGAVGLAHARSHVHEAPAMQHEDAVAGGDLRDCRESGQHDRDGDHP